MPVINPTPSVPGPSAPGAAPCAWTLDTTCCPEWAGYTNVVRDRATAWATQILWALSGRRYGLCEVTVRPCGPSCDQGGGWRAYPVTADGVGTVWSPFIREGSWFNCGCAGACRCEPSCRVWLPGPVAAITEVLVDGVVIDPSRYRVDNGTWLVGQLGQCWPECQDLDLLTSEVNTMAVTYQRGTPVPLGGQIAAGMMACEFAKACVGGACALPSNLSSLARQGIQVSMIDPTDVLQAGYTGIPEVDLWIRSVNPRKQAARTRVYSPDLHYPVQRTS